jgi:outer membrane beta-barrel protein
MLTTLVTSIALALAASPSMPAPTQSSAPVPNAPAPVASAPQRPAEAQPQEEAPPQPEPPKLEDRIPPVSAQAFTKAGKVEITLGLGLSLDDAFIEKLIPELSIGYHFDDAFYLGLRGGYAFDFNAGHVDACDQTGANCGSPTASQVKQLPGNFTALGALQFAWSPIYGKLNFFGEKVLHFDTAFLIDGGVLFLGRQVGSTNGRTAPEVSPGLGERFFFTSAFALAFELRDMIYASGGVQNEIMFHFGLTFLL